MHGTPHLNLRFFVREHMGAMPRLDTAEEVALINCNGREMGRRPLVSQHLITSIPDRTDILLNFESKGAGGLDGNTLPEPGSTPAKAASCPTTVSPPKPLPIAYFLSPTAIAPSRSLYRSVPPVHGAGPFCHQPDVARPSLTVILHPEALVSSRTIFPGALVHHSISPFRFDAVKILMPIPRRGEIE